MKTMLFQTVVGLIVAEFVAEYEKIFVLKNPGLIQPVMVKDPQTGNDVRATHITPIFSDYFSDHKDLNSNFELMKTHVVWSGGATENICNLYENYSKNLSMHLTGIMPATPKDLHNLNHGKGNRGLKLIQ